MVSEYKGLGASQFVKDSREEVETSLRLLLSQQGGRRSTSFVEKAAQELQELSEDPRQFIEKIRELWESGMVDRARCKVE